MSNDMEIEAKMLLSEDEYNKIAIHLIKMHPRVMDQTNYYLDTKDFKLSKYGLALRIRELDHSYELTLKAPLSEGLLEKSTPLTPKQFKDISNDINEPNPTFEFLKMLGFDTDQIHIICSLNTYRIEIDYEDGLLCIDKNKYGDKIDYEIEMESDSMQHAISIMKQFLEEAKVEFHELNHVSKHRRAMNEILK